MSTALIDARDGFVQPLRGWGRYVAALVGHLPAALEPHGIRLTAVRDGGPLPEVAFEQAGLPLRARRLKADLLHAPNVWLPLLRPCPGVVTIHDLAFEDPVPGDFGRVTGAKFRLLAPRAARSADAVICVSRFTADDVVARYGVDPARVHVVPNGPALPLGDAPVPAGEPYLLAVGDLRPKKNLDRLVAAWAAGAGGGRRLVLAGAGRRDPSWPAGVEVTGYVDDATLDALLRGADLLVHPSLYEGFGLVVAEAMARGVPVACADATALPETAAGAAVLFDPRDVDALGAAIDEALARAGELHVRGLARARELTWERAARATAEVYRAVLR
jgi:glycosyltransferase involved in cell wall biosynthesis